MKTNNKTELPRFTSTAASYRQCIPDKLQIWTRSPATWREEPPLPHPLPPPSHRDPTGSPSFLRPPGVELRRRADRWPAGASETADGERRVRWAESVSVPGGVGQGCSEALECCSEPRTLGGAMTLMLQTFHLKSEVPLKSAFILPVIFLMKRFKCQARLSPV